MDILKNSLLMFLLLTVLTGVVYPAAVTLVAQAVFPRQANGSRIFDKNHTRCLGSELLGQEFKSPRYFWSRPSATSSSAYNAAASGGSNWGPSNDKFFQAVSERTKSLQAAHGSAAIPVDLVTASGSGLDPHISVPAAQYQAARVAQGSGVSLERIHEMIKNNTEERQFGFLGETRVNVVRLNMELDKRM
jgi:K+-transporting ATPase ATPase C chain